MKLLRKYGWRRSAPNPNDRPFTHARVSQIPAVSDLTAHDIGIFDQLDIGSCTANAWLGLLRNLENREGLKGVALSRLMLYWLERARNGQTATDSGAEISDGAAVLLTQGVGASSFWPYDPKKFAERPPAEAFADAGNHKGLEDGAVEQSVDGLRTVLSAGYPVVIGIEVFPSFESDQVAADGIIPMPGSSEQTIGGHAICIVGHDDAKQQLKFRNSWGSKWGSKGYGFLPYSYITSALASDFRSLKLVK